MNLVGKNTFATCNPMYIWILYSLHWYIPKLKMPQGQIWATHGLQILLYGAKSKVHFEELHKASFHMT